ncbi:MAG: methionine biosynthesis protein MetW [Chthoniobacterales bacterium]
MMESRARNDNRQYSYGTASFSPRPEYGVIAGWIPNGSKVIDLGCGNGSFMHHLLEEKKASVEGIERAPLGVEHCLAHGLSARVGEIDRHETYADYAAESFDFAVCNVTLHMVMYPEVLLGEMARIARNLVFSFPNFGHIFNRLDLFFTGRMPRPQLFGYEWFDTGQIHQLGLGDFLKFCRRHSLRVARQRHIGHPALLANLVPSLFSRTAIYLCVKEV